LSQTSPFAALTTIIEPKLPSLVELEHWLAHSEPGAKIIYARCLQLDESAETRAVARLAWLAYERGQVELAQKRDGDAFLYVCQKRREVKPISVPRGCGRTDT